MWKIDYFADSVRVKPPRSRSPRGPRHMGRDLVLDAKEGLKAFTWQDSSDLLLCQTAKTSKTARQCGMDVGKSGLREPSNSPRFANRKQRPPCATKKRNRYYVEDREYSNAQGRVNEPVCMVANNLHLLLYKSYCGDVELNRRQVLTGKVDTNESPNLNSLFVQSILSNVHKRKRMSEQKNRAADGGSRTPKRSRSCSPNRQEGSRSKRSRSRSAERPKEKKARRETSSDETDIPLPYGNPSQTSLQVPQRPLRSAPAADYANFSRVTGAPLYRAPLYWARGYFWYP